MGIVLIAKRSAWSLLRRKIRGDEVPRATFRRIESMEYPTTGTVGNVSRARGTDSPVLCDRAAVSVAMAMAERPGMGPFGVFCDFAPTMPPDEDQATDAVRRRNVEALKARGRARVVGASCPQTSRTSPR